MQDAKSLVEPCAWENVVCPGEWPAGPFSEVRHPGLPPHHLSVHVSHDDTTRGVDLVPIQVFTQETQRTLSICQFLCFPDIRSFHPGWINPYSIIVMLITVIGITIVPISQMH